MKKIMVSICCITYNHENYIKECLEGFIMQQTNFQFEILIHDDASTDNTAKIIEEYELKYPDIIKPIYQTENQYSKNIGSINVNFNYPRAKGKYIALCEGDDYWVDFYKLQKQVDFLETNKNFSMCCSARIIYNQQEQTSIKVNAPDIVTTSDILSGIVPFTQTMLFRLYDDYYNDRKKFVNEVAGDRVLSYLMSLKGNIKTLPDYMAVYRVTGTGVWSSKNNETMVFDNLDSLQSFYKIIGLPKKNKFFYRALYPAHLNVFFSKTTRQQKFTKFSKLKKQYSINRIYYIWFALKYLAEIFMHQISKLKLKK